MPLRLATYNFLLGGSAKRYGHLERLVRELDPDVVFTQEAGPALRADAADEANPHATRNFWQPVPGHRWGSGVVVRGVPCTPISVPEYEGWVVGAELTLARPARMFSVHCPAGPGGYVRTMHRILDALAPLRAGADVVIGGDLNVATGYRGPADGRTMSRGERELLDRMGGEFDLIACWQCTHPGVPLAQTLRWSAERTTPYHCDGIFIPRAWQPQLTRCEILADDEWQRLSDHNPVFAEVALDVQASSER